MDSAVVAKTIAVAAALHAVFTIAVPLWLWSATRAALPRLPLGPLRWLGLGLIGFGIYLYVWSLAHLLRRDTSALPGQAPRVLDTSGWYARVRHPLLLGVVAILFGEAVVAASWALLAYALFYWALLHRFVVRREEPELLATFGAAYADYTARVPRWLPRRGGPR
ncbi:MAG: isoprenylcysteine carboxylmethyltransferase family protein [Deltaproteobacteria bacterium]|nr:isoprenylcysteine carboxylmethyltransferase family protein [Deltaproteobacteria bacterium]